MKKIVTILILILLSLVLASSGCIKNTEATSIWGEKKISLDNIKVANNTTGNHSLINESRYHVYGYINNDNPYDALNVKIKVTTFDSNGTAFALNDTPYLEPKSIPAKGSSYFYARFNDPDKKIATFKVEVLSAKAEYWT